MEYTILTSLQVSYFLIFPDQSDLKQWDIYKELYFISVLTLSQSCTDLHVPIS